MTELAVRGRPFPPGVSGNPNGRPVGHRTRHQFSASFLADLAEVWAEHGRETMLRTAKTSPETFFATCARLLPKDVELTIRQHYTGLDESDLMILRAIRDAIPNANELETASGAGIRARCNPSSRRATAHYPRHARWLVFVLGLARSTLCLTT